MKKFFIAIMAIATLSIVSCNKEEEKTADNTSIEKQDSIPTGNQDSTSIEGRWDAPRFADNPNDIAFVAIFAGENLDLYIIAWGQHYVGTYTLTDGTVNYNITEAYQAYTDVAYNGEGEMTSWSWSAGNLDATTLTLSEGYNWYTMKEEDLNSYKENLGEFGFNINGATASSSLFGIPDMIFPNVQ